MGLRKLNRIIIMIAFGTGILADSLFSRVSSKDTSEVMHEVIEINWSLHAVKGYISNSTKLIPDTKTCGIHNSDRIFGGTRTDLDEHPWMALLKYNKGRYWEFRCGGSLISSKYVMTAAHCVVPKKKQQEPWQLTHVRLAEWDIRTNRDCTDFECSNAATEIYIDRKIPHKDYDPEDIQQYNDIALLRLSYKINFSDFIKPICLPIASDLRKADFNGFEMEVAGWGMTESGFRSNVKLKVRVPVVDNKQCNRVYNLKNRTITMKQICAGGKEKEDSCKGDSGGPLMGQVSNSGNWMAIGIVSYGPRPCGLRDWPAVHTKVGPYVNWILSQLEP